MYTATTKGTDRKNRGKSVRSEGLTKEFLSFTDFPGEGNRDAALGGSACSGTRDAVRKKKKKKINGTNQKAITEGVEGRGWGGTSSNCFRATSIAGAKQDDVNKTVLELDVEVDISRRGGDRDDLQARHVSLLIFV